MSEHVFKGRYGAGERAKQSTVEGGANDQQLAETISHVLKARVFVCVCARSCSLLV